MSEVLTQAQALLKERLAEIDVERRQLEEALKELNGVTTSRGRRRRSAAAAGPSQGGTSKRRRRKSPSKTSPAQKKAVADYLRSNPGASTVDVVQALGLSDGRVVGAQRRKLAAPPE